MQRVSLALHCSYSNKKIHTVSAMRAPLELVQMLSNTSNMHAATQTTPMKDVHRIHDPLSTSTCPVMKGMHLFEVSK